MTEKLTPEDTVLEPHMEYRVLRAYDAYSESVGGLTWNGLPIPPWQAITARQRNGWRAAIKAALI